MLVKVCCICLHPWQLTTFGWYLQAFRNSKKCQQRAAGQHSRSWASPVAAVQRLPPSSAPARKSQHMHLFWKKCLAILNGHVVHILSEGKTKQTVHSCLDQNACLNETIMKQANNDALLVLHIATSSRMRFVHVSHNQRASTKTMYPRPRIYTGFEVGNLLPLIGLIAHLWTPGPGLALWIFGTHAFHDKGIIRLLQRRDLKECSTSHMAMFLHQSLIKAAPTLNFISKPSDCKAMSPTKTDTAQSGLRQKDLGVAAGLLHGRHHLRIRHFGFSQQLLPQGFL